MNVHEVWAITDEKSQHICSTKKGQLCTYRTQQEAVTEMADFIKTNPDKVLVLRKTTIKLPWMV